MSQEDRREFNRLCKTFRVTLKKLEFPLAQQKDVVTQCLNISASGLLLECGIKYQIGDKLRVVIQIPSLNKFHPGFFKVFESDVEQNLTAVAEVVRSDGEVEGRMKVGLRFVDVYEDDWKALHSMIMKQLSV